MQTRNSHSSGRPRSFDEDTALQGAMDVFWAKGFEGASIMDLTRAMGIKAASLYGAFGNKQQLFRKALDRYRLQQLTFIQDALQELSAYSVAERLLRDTATFLTRPGLPPRCLTMQTCAASEQAVEIHNELIAVRQDAQKALRNRLARAKREGDLPKDANPANLARFVMTLMQGMNIQSIGGATQKELLDLVRTALRAWPSERLA